MALNYLLAYLFAFVLRLTSKFFDAMHSEAFFGETFSAGTAWSYDMPGFYQPLFEQHPSMIDTFMAKYISRMMNSSATKYVGPRWQPLQNHLKR